MNDLQKELQKLIDRNKPKINQADSRQGYQALSIRVKRNSFDFPINDFTIANQKTTL